MPIIKRIINRLLAICVGLLFAQYNCAAELISRSAPHWLPLAKDELHDPAMISLKLLQNPGEALSKLPYDGAGNQVNWAKALEEGNIKPRVNIQKDTVNKLLDLDVLLKDTGEMDMVIFPHKQHTEWLSCVNCHEGIFKSKAGANKFGMFEILNGEFCGRCHSAVAFPLTECSRCHKVPRLPKIIMDQSH